MEICVSLLSLCLGVSIIIDLFYMNKTNDIITEQQHKLTIHEITIKCLIDDINKIQAEIED